jgi:hypothetical protein
MPLVFRVASRFSYRLLRPFGLISIRTYRVEPADQAWIFDADREAVTRPEAKTQQSQSRLGLVLRILRYEVCIARCRDSALGYDQQAYKYGELHIVG